VARPGHSPTLADLQRFLKDDKRVAVYKLPEYLLPVDSLPRNAVGKILKRQLRERARALAPQEHAI
jgi:acyl-CoA synthetase (AMP-forming)/AMP-acid ligase II